MTSGFRERLQAEREAFDHEQQQVEEKDAAVKRVLRLARVAASSDYDPWIVDGVEPSFVRVVDDKAGPLRRDFYWILKAGSVDLASRITQLASAINDLIGDPELFIPRHLAMK